jgi:hypothetical protein
MAAPLVLRRLAGLSEPVDAVGDSDMKQTGEKKDGWSERPSNLLLPN